MTHSELYGTEEYLDLLNEGSPRIKTPDKINTELKLHQQATLAKCNELEHTFYNPIVNQQSQGTLKTKVGIIADKVGSGKTLTILSIIANNPKLKIPDFSKITSNELIFYEETTITPYVTNHNLIIVPHTIYKQWCATIEENTNLNYYGIYNKKTLDKFIDIYTTDVVENVNTSRAKEREEFKNNDIILLTNTKVKDFFRIYTTYWKSNELIFNRIFIDEAETIKNVQYIYLNQASFIWFVTSSYNTLLYPAGKRYYKNTQTNTISESYNYQTGHTRLVTCYRIENTGIVKNIMNSLIDKYKNRVWIKNIIVKNDNKFVEESFSLPKYNTFILECKTPHYLNILNGNISSEIMNHINAGDIEGAIDKLNCKKVSEGNLIEAITNEFQANLQNLNIDLNAALAKTYSSPQAKEESISKIKIKIAIMNKKITNIKEKMEASNICCICYDDVTNMTIAPCCNTKYCFQCISTWLVQSHNCPFCREQMSINSLIIVSDKVEEKMEDEEELKDKLTNLKNLIIKQKKALKNNFKMLIFSDYDGSFFKISEMIQSLNINYGKVMGSSSVINKTISKFKSTSEDSISILLLNAQYCANGINLENSSDIVFYHNMNKDKTMQIIGRGQRPGRTMPLNVWKLCYNNEK